jgi:hypothetical protein
MKTLKLTSLFLVAIAMLMTTSCGKYEDGPALSLLPKKTRLVGIWKVEKYVDADGTESTPASGDNSTVEYVNDGKVIYIWSGGGFSQTTEGTWAFSDDKENLEITFTAGSISQTSSTKIVRLTNSELWLQDDNGDETHMIPA